MRILVIQESKEYVQHLRDRLAQEGSYHFQFEGAESLKAGLERMQQENFDLVLLELALPDSQGIVAFEEIQSRSPHTPIIILTGLENELNALKALRQGAQDYLLKNEIDARYFGRAVRNAIERQRVKSHLINLSFRDDLTGLFNRRGFIFLSEQQMRVSERSKKGFALILADLDGLKKINDTYGHPQGDHAIAHTANILRQTFRRSDILARLGGDEFAVTALEADEHKGALMMKRLRFNIERHNEMQISQYPIQLSVGYCFYDPAKPETLESLIAKADQALYSVKKGRE